ncbi:dienelactone hydrolase family protein [Candidatus Woesearchaeota archaeon]|nr:dienelactone hydrolase family protein [Candidatus Woesearchaeota archaeon]
MKREHIFGIFLAAALFMISCAQQAPVADDNNLIRNADMIKTGNNGSGIEIRTSEINYGPAAGYLAQPKEPGNYPGIVMIHEWIGLNDYVREMARQLAAEGYVVLAVDLYEGKVAKDSTEARALSTGVRNNIPTAVSNMKSAVAYLKTLDNVDGSKIASMGWCFGGAMSLQLALNQELAATVIYYGNLETNTSKLSFIEWPVLGIFGEADTSIPAATVRQFDAALDELGIENEIYIYPNVGHAFANPSGMNYAAEETKDAWKKTVEFLGRSLKNN